MIRQLCTWTFVLIIATAALSSQAQAQHKLYMPDNHWVGAATMNATTLVITDRLNGTSITYKREATPKYDAEGYWGYKKDKPTADNTGIQWPVSNAGLLKKSDDVTKPFNWKDSEVSVGKMPSAQPTPTPPEKAGRYLVMIESALPGDGLVASGGGLMSNVGIGEKGANDTRNQFYLQFYTDDYFTLTPLSDPAVVVTLADKKGEIGSNVMVWPSHGKKPEDAALFRFRSGTNGYFYIESKVNKYLVWNVDGAEAKNGVNIRLMTKSLLDSQMFRVRKP